MSFARSLASLDLLAETWDDFVARTSADGVTTSWSWIRGWSESERATHAPYFAVARDEAGRLAGIAPLAIVRASLHLVFAGDSFYSEFSAFALRRDCEGAAMDAICHALAATHGRDWKEATLRFVGTDTRFESSFVATAQRHGLAFRAVRHDVAPYVTLPATIDAYYATHGPAFPKRIAQSERRLASEGAVTLRIARDAGDVDELFDAFAALFAARWGATMSATFADFLRARARASASSELVILAVLYVGEVPVAARYDLVHRGHVSNYLGGWDDAWAKFKVGNVLIARLIRLCIERGYRTYDFLAGDAEYKRRWATGVRGLVDLALVRALPGAIAPHVATNTPSARASGHVDRIHVAEVAHDRRLIVLGWIAVDGATRGPLTAFVEIDGARHEVGYGVPRPDVASALGDPAKLRIGFSGVVALDDVAPGSHTVRVGLHDFGSASTRYLDATSTFEIGEAT